MEKLRDKAQTAKVYFVCCKWCLSCSGVMTSVMRTWTMEENVAGSYDCMQAVLAFFK